MKFFLALALLCSTLLSFGQTDTTTVDPYDMSLEQLLNIKVSVTKTNLNSREIPSIVSVITQEDIKNMGARDLMDILNQVPGMNFGVDVQNIVGLGVRGNWGHEGKILLLIDGNEMNEILFATTQFGQHYNIYNIERIEIIRGPGSSIHGGYAELGVINIITKKGNQMNEVSLGSSFGISDGETARKNIRLNIGSGTEKVNYSFAGVVGNGLRSTKMYTDIYGARAKMKDIANLEQLMFSGGLNAGNFSLNMIYDGYHVNSGDQFDSLIIDPIDKIGFSNFYTTAKYDIKPAANITITPRLNFKIGEPWKSLDNSPFPYSVKASRFAPSINASINPNEHINLVLGIDSYFDNASLKDNNASFSNTGVFVQSVFKNTLANVTVGARFDNHSQFGSAFSPRFGITKAWPNFHIKALYSRAFRSPSIENISRYPTVKPEKTGVAEIEFGYKINDHMFLTANGYHILISDPIVYFVDADNPSGTYGNFDRAGSLGFEIDYRLKYDWGSVSANYAFYSSSGINRVSYYNSTFNDQSVLALPNGRINVLSNIKLSPIFSLNPSFNLLSKRYSVTGLDESDNYVYSKIDPQFISNLFVRAKNKNFDVGIGVYNITDENQVFIQPYNSGHAPLPGLGREIMINFQYSIPIRN